MRKIIANVELTLNGIMEAPHTWPSFKTEDVDEFIQASMSSGDGALLFGRVTYDMFASFWPSQTDYIGQYMNDRPKYVVSSTLNTASWQNTIIIRGGFEEIQALKEQSGGDIVMLGSGTLIESLSQVGLVDEFRLWIHPLLMERGRRLFHDGHRTEFQLVRTHAFRGGIVLLVYKPADKHVGRRH